MREKTHYWQIAQTRAYQEMVQQKSKVVTRLTWIVLFFFAVFTGAAIMAPGFMATPVSGDGGMPWGVAYSIFFIVMSVVCSGYYTHWANTRFDVMQREVLQQFDGGQDEA